MEKRKTALIVVDVQSAFVTDQNKWVLKNIENLLRCNQYSAYVEVVFSASVDSIWYKQLNWTLPKQDTILEIKNIIPHDNYIFIEKTTKSAFKGDKDLLSFLKQNNIQEVHVIGFDTNDCVFATVNEAFDLGFFSYVIEDCTASSESEEMRKAALSILRDLDMVIRS